MYTPNVTESHMKFPTLDKCGYLYQQGVAKWRRTQTAAATNPTHHIH